MNQPLPSIDNMRSEQWKQKREYDPFCAMSESEKRALCTIRNWKIVAAVLLIALVISWLVR